MESTCDLSGNMPSMLLFVLRPQAKAVAEAALSVTSALAEYVVANPA